MTPYLPSLPVLPGEDETYQYMPPGRSIITLLAQAHGELTSLSGELARAPAPGRDEADRLTAAVTRHLSAERQYLYPTVAKLFPGEDGDIPDRDTSLLVDLASLHQAALGSQAFRDGIQAIDSGLRQHQHACDVDIFPKLDGVVSKADLVRLGNRAEVALEAAPSRPHPKAPMRAPWNKVTDAALGAYDKIRDLVSGRRTYPLRTVHHVRP